MEEFSPDYEFWHAQNKIYGKNNPFAPSLARTTDGKPIDPKLLSGSESCGTAGCHEQIVKEWQPSAHRYAALDKSFQAIQLTMAKQNGPNSTRYCGGCHDPISLFSGTKNIYTDESKLTALHGYQEGISCLSCHSIRETDLRGNANFRVQKPARYIGEMEYDASRSGGWRFVRDFLIRAYPRGHVAGLSKVMFKKPQYCAACHKQFVDEEVNKVGWVQLQNQYDNWRMSKWARDLRNPKRTVECRECHMPLVASRDPASGDPYDYNRAPDDGKHRSHRFVGANQYLPALLKLAGADEQVRLTHRWLKGEIPIPEIEDKWHKPGVPAVALQLRAPGKVHPGEQISLRCIVTSNKVGHDFPTGPLDIIQAWVEIVARDETGRVVYESGTVDKKGFVKPGSFMFKSEPVDQYGNLIDRHNLWEMVGVRHRRSLFPGFSDTTDFTFFCPELGPKRKKKLLPAKQQFSFTAPGSGKLTVTARLRYRKIDQFLLNYMRSVGFFSEFKGQRLTAPITDMHTQTAVIEVGPTEVAVAPGRGRGL
jgi:cytochrome c554/c'-like protein